MLKTKGYYYQQNHYSCSIKNRAVGNRAAGTNAKSSFIKGLGLLLVPLHPRISRPSYGPEKYYKKGLCFSDVASLGRESTYITLKHTTKALEKRYTLTKACLIDICWAKI